MAEIDHHEGEQVPSITVSLRSVILKRTHLSNGACLILPNCFDRTLRRKLWRRDRDLQTSSSKVKCHSEARYKLLLA